MCSRSHSQELYMQYKRSSRNEVNVYNVQDEKRLYVKNQEALVQSSQEAEESLDEPARPPGSGSAAAKRKRSATSKSLDVETGGVEIFNENENTLYCVCQQPYNVDTSMIECDSCHEWYHVKCVGLSQVR